MKAAVTFLVYLTIRVIQAGHHGSGKYKCIHDRISSRIPERQIIEKELEYQMGINGERLLQSTIPARNMIISYDMSYYNQLPQTQQNYDFKTIVQKAIDISLDYLSKLLTIKQKPPGYMKWDLNTRKCGLMTIPLSDIQKDKASDLHLYITFTNEPNEGYIAYAGWCRFIKGIGATHGQVNFNKGILLQENFNDPLIYQEIIQTTIHEIIHVLGFSKDDFTNWVDQNGRPYAKSTINSMIRGRGVTFIATPNVLKAAQQYYNCPNIQGMPVENLGEEGSAGSHWKTSSLLDEMMNPSASATNSILSIFTIALLRDTGFYQSVNSNFEEPSLYGRNQGCSFVYDRCQPKNEYCQNNKKKQCDFYHHGSASCTSTDYNEAGCNIMQVQSQDKCFDSTNNNRLQNVVNQTGGGFGFDSKCFMSNLNSNTFNIGQEQPMCYRYQCTDGNQIILQVGNSTILCSKNSQKIQVQGYAGTLSCPDDILAFCAYKKFCLDHCSANGYCINGVCLCNKGFTGINCSIQV